MFVIVKDGLFFNGYKYVGSGKTAVSWDKEQCIIFTDVPVLHEVHRDFEDSEIKELTLS